MIILGSLFERVANQVFCS